MSPRVKKFSFFGALSAALAFVLNVVFFCHKSHNKAQGSKHRQDQVSHAIEQEALLPSGESSQQSSESGQAGTASEQDPSAKPAPDKPEGVATGSAVPSEKAGPHDQPVPCEEFKRGPAEGQPGTAGPVDPADVSTDFLQDLIDAELGPPKFTVPKEAPRQQEAPSLEAFLVEQLGPPRFAVAKPSTPKAENGSTSAPLEAQASPSGQGKPASVLPEHYLRLEVISGPAVGTVFNTEDKGSEVRIGRLPECSLSLTDDHEVSSKHATIHYSATDNCWKLIDVGSLNGSTLNGVALTSNRKPSAPHPLTSGDTVTFGSVTKLKVVCAPSHVRKQPAAGGANGSKAAAPSAAAPQPQQASRQAAYSTAPGGAIAAAAAARGSDPGAVIAAAAGGAGAGVGVGQHRTFGANAADVVRRPGMSAQMLQTLHFVGPPLAVRHHAELGVSLAVQQRLGSDHRLTNTGCEDVAHWEVPWSTGGAQHSSTNSALLCIFDGHQGVQAATRAKEVLPQLLRTKLEALGPSGHPASLIRGRSASDQASLLQQLFLETDTTIAMDEGCTATVLLMEREDDGHVIVQSANVGDSSAVLVQLPPPTTPHTGAASTQGNGHAATHTPSTTNSQHTDSHLAQHFTHSPTLTHDQAQQQASTQAQAQQAGSQQPAYTVVNGTVHVPLQTAQPSQPPFAPPDGTEGGAIDGGGHWVKLSEDHRIGSSAKERARLADLGHRTVRTRLYGLNISRMLGDKFLKDEALGFIADPHVSPRLRIRLKSSQHTPTTTTNTHTVTANTTSASQPGDSGTSGVNGCGGVELYTDTGTQGGTATSSSVLPQQASSVETSAHTVLQGVGASGMTDTSAGVSAGVQGTGPTGQGSVGSHSSVCAATQCGRTFLVMASDGLWDVVSEGKAAGHMARTVAQDPETSVAELASLLVGQAVNARSKDDITVIVMELH